MSEHEPELQPMQLSKVKLTRNAKGEPQWEISVVEGADMAELDRIRDMAIAQYNALTAAGL